jgi:hypothetical protein
MTSSLSPGPSAGPRAGSVLAGLAVAAAAVAALLMRLQDPASSLALPAEDPYTHLAIVKEALREGAFHPFNSGGGLYPPGLHALLATTAVYTGVGLYDLFRYGPAYLGALGVVGLALLAWRWSGPLAAATAALAAALGPELVFRTSMMAPTALDLALLPFLFLALMGVATGRLGWGGPAAALLLFLVVAHPWTLLIVGLAGGALLVLGLAFPWPARWPALTAAGLATAVALVGLSVALALSGCGGACGGGLVEVTSGSLASFALPVAAAALVPLLVLRFAPVRSAALVARLQRPRSLPARIAGSALLAIAATALTAVALRQGLPDLVDPPRMFGWPALLLAAAGFVALPFLRSPLAVVGAALAAATYPFVVFNPLHSAFWPHRTAVYLALAIVLLAASVVPGAVRALWALQDRAPPHAAARPGGDASPGPLAMAPAILLVAGLGVGLVAATPLTHPPWYRLYEPCAFAALQAIANQTADRPAALVVTGTWQSKLVIAALAPNATRVWYKPEFFTSPRDRDALVAFERAQHRPLLAVADPLLNTTRGADASFLQAAPWTPLGSWCAGTADATRAAIVGDTP